MKINEAYPSKWLTAADLQDRPQRVKINYVEMVDVGGGERKPAMHMIGKSKAIILNKTNANTIASLYGQDTDDWSEAEIEIYPSETDFQGERKPCIRVRAVPRGDKSVQQHAGMASRVMPGTAIAPNARTRAEYDERNPPPVEDLGDEVPF